MANSPKQEQEKAPKLRIAPEPAQESTPKLDTTDPLLGCLEFLTRYYERPHSAEALKATLPETGKPLTADLFVRAANKVDLGARVAKKRLKAFSPVLLPAVLILKGQEAALLIRIDRDKVQIHLPEAGGVREISRDQLQKIYAGYAILVSPKYRRATDQDIAPDNTPRRWVWPALRSNLGIYGQVLVAALLVNMFSLATPVFIMTVYDRVIPNSAIETLSVLAIGVTTILIFDFLIRT